MWCDAKEMRRKISDKGSSDETMRSSRLSMMMLMTAKWSRKRECCRKRVAEQFERKMFVCFGRFAISATDTTWIWNQKRVKFDIFATTKEIFPKQRNMIIFRLFLKLHIFRRRRPKRVQSTIGSDTDDCRLRWRHTLLLLLRLDDAICLRWTCKNSQNEIQRQRRRWAKGKLRIRIYLLSPMLIEQIRFQLNCECSRDSTEMVGFRWRNRRKFSANVTSKWTNSISEF